MSDESSKPYPYRPEVVDIEIHNEALTKIKSLEMDYEGALSDMSEMEERIAELEEENEARFAAYCKLDDININLNERIKLLEEVCGELVAKVEQYAESGCIEGYSHGDKSLGSVVDSANAKLGEL